MMNKENIQTTQSNTVANALIALRGFLRTRAGIVITAALAITGGLYFGWGYVLAAGLAPLILGVAPCAAMCALGLCMGGHKSSPDVASSTNLNQIGTSVVNAGEAAGLAATPLVKKQGKGCC